MGKITEFEVLCGFGLNLVVIVATTIIGSQKVSTQHGRVKP